MNVSGPTAAMNAYRMLGDVRGVGAAAPARPAAPTAPTAPTESAHASAAATMTVPAGSDPALWSILTSDERDFFARQASMGPLSYGPSRQSAMAPDAPLGQRIDIRA